MMSDKTHIKRILSNFLPETKEQKIILLTGARQTGKTTLAREKYPDLRYINLDAPENREAVKGVLSDFWARDVGSAVIDEAQKEPVVFDKVKYAYDAQQVSFSVLLGSSQILLLKKVRESLAGRVSLYELWPLLMSEIASGAQPNFSRPAPLLDQIFSDNDLSAIFSQVPARLMGLDHGVVTDAESYLLQWGGMPALLPLDEEARWKWLKDYEYTYLERDLGDLARLDDLEPFRKFQKLSALRSGQLLNYSEIARDAAVSVDTARRYLEYLRLSYQVILLQPFYKNITSSVVKTPKLYWLDVGLLRQLCGYTGEASGEVYETMVVGELYKWMKTTQKRAEMYFYRTRSGLETDILLKTPAGVTGMEVKGRAVLSSKDYSSLKEVAAGLGSQWRGGLVIYRGDEIKRVAEPNIWAVPSKRLFG